MADEPTPAEKYAAFLDAFVDGVGGTYEATTGTAPSLDHIGTLHEDSLHEALFSAWLVAQDVRGAARTFGVIA